MTNRLTRLLSAVICSSSLLSGLAQADVYLDRLQEAILSCEDDAQAALRQIEATRTFLVEAGRADQAFVDLLTLALPCVSGVYGREMYLTDDLSFRSLAALEREHAEEAALRLQQCNELQDRKRRYLGLGRLRLSPDEKAFLAYCLAEGILPSPE